MYTKHDLQEAYLRGLEEGVDLAKAGYPFQDYWKYVSDNLTEQQLVSLKHFIFIHLGRNIKNIRVFDRGERHSENDTQIFDKYEYGRIISKEPKSGSWLIDIDGIKCVCTDCCGDIFIFVKLTDLQYLLDPNYMKR